jgi:pantoate--beta-alanine ligase
MVVQKQSLGSGMTETTEAGRPAAPPSPAIAGRAFLLGDTGMKVIETINEMRQARKKLAEPVGFVATMGALHAGHVSLIRQARAENASAVVSIFVNPAQFGPGEDFASYPRDPRGDLALLEREKVDVVFMPPVQEIYPPGFDSWVEVNGVTERLEGASRPSHFRGVATVVNKLFDIIEPARSYFGQKDAQQTIVIKKMVADLAMNVEIIVMPTVRETDGLAVSSRNAYLNPKEHRAATVLFRALSLAEQLWGRGEKDAGKIKQEMTRLIMSEPLAAIDYISTAHPQTLEEMEEVKPPALVSLAVKIGKTRLIDNVVVG